MHAALEAAWLARLLELQRPLVSLGIGLGLGLGLGLGFGLGFGF